MSMEDAGLDGGMVQVRCCIDAAEFCAPFPLGEDFNVWVEDHRGHMLQPAFEGRPFDPVAFPVFVAGNGGTTA